MPRLAAPLGPLSIKNLKEPGYHAVGTVPGLYLQVAPSGAKSWVLRVVAGRKRREIGLGGYPAVQLGAAHEAARANRDLVKSGIDPVEARKEARSRLLAAQASAKTFKDCALKYIDAHEASWKNPKHAQQWRNTLETYAYPVMGSLLVRDVELTHVLKVLEPIWKTKTETATRLRGRIESVLDWATTREYRHGPNPARWNGHLETMLAAPSKVRRVEHFQALDAALIGEFMQALRKRDGMAARALEFLILTAVRAGNVRKATWSELDLDAGVWTIPGDEASSAHGQRMKSGREHRVPLSEPAIKLLKALPRIADSGDLVFPGAKGKPLSDMALTVLLRKMKVEAVPHGFRATFKTWATEERNYPRELVEVALAHALTDKLEAAYMRGDMFEKRRRLMQDWARFVGAVRPKQSDRVVPLRAAA